LSSAAASPWLDVRCNEMFGGVLDLDVFRYRRWLRDGKMILAKTADMKVDRLGHMSLSILGSVTGRDATGQIGGIR